MYSLIDLPKFRSYKGQAVRIIQQKLNGYYVQVYRSAGDDVTVLTKNQTENIWPKLSRCSALKNSIMSLPDNTRFEAELYAPGVLATSIPTLLNDGDNRLLIGPFAVHQYAGEDMHRAGIETINRLRRPGIIPAEYSICDERKLTKIEISNLLNRAQNEHLEGWVLKEDHHQGWYKLKPVKTVDCVVTGFTLSESDSKYGALKAIQVSVWNNNNLVEIASVGGGFTDDYRWSVNPKILTGRVAEIEYDCVASNGKLNFPRFVRWRKDKPAKQCMIEQLEE